MKAASGRATPNSPGPLRGLTSIRAFAALHVVLYHMWPFFLPSTADSRFCRHFVRLGHVGVNLFFILSGYILAYVYLAPEPERALDRERFWTARFARVYPVYALAFLLESPLIAEHVLARADRARETAIAAGTLAANLALVQAWAPVLKWRWNYPSWTLSVEGFFYLLFPFLGVWIWKRAKSAGPAGFAAVYALMLAPALAWWAAHPQRGGGTTPDWLFVTPVLRLPEFALGVLLMRRESLARDAERAARRAPLLLAAGLGGLLIGFALSDFLPDVLYRCGLLDPFFMLLILALARARGRLAAFMSLRPLVLLGEASYAVYILQAPVQEWLIRAGRAAGVEFGGADHPLAFAGFLFLLIAGSLLSYEFVEVPARDRLRGADLGRFFRKARPV